MSLFGFFLVGCSEFTVQQKPEDVQPVAEPPGETESLEGEPPDWTDCDSGFYAQYFNLDTNDTGINVSSPGWLDNESWLNRDPSFERYDPSLDFGPGWWPVDEGIAGDPGYFVVVWYGWLRVRDDQDLPVVAGAATDLLVLVNREVVLSLEDQSEFVGQEYRVSLDAGVYPIEVRYSHRLDSVSGMRFRLGVEEDRAQLCYPSYP